MPYLNLNGNACPRDLSERTYILKPQDTRCNGILPEF